MNLNQLNLNLIRALDSLLRAKNVTIAANQIGVSQSSMSLSLKQLREHFNDQLLVPGRQRIMILTPLASSLIGEVRAIMNHIERVLSTKESFDPKSSQRTFRIGMSDLVSIYLLKPLIKRIRELAPNIQLNIIHPKYLTSSSTFESRQLDLSLGMFLNVPTSLKTQLLFEDETVVACCEKHPVSNKDELQLTDFIEYPLILFALDDHPFDNYTTKCINQVNANKSIEVTVGQALTSIYALPDTEYMTLTVKRAATHFKDKLGLKMFEAPFEVDDFSCRQYWHPKDDTDPSHRWLRNMIKEIADGL